MKKQLLKLTMLAFVVLFSASTIQAQALWTVNGTYKISTSGLSPNLYMTIDASSGDLVWAEELADGADAAQIWSVIDHRSPASSGLMEITSDFGGIDWTMTTAPANVSTDHPGYTITVEQRVPKTVEAGDWSGLDQFQRRKAKVNSEGLADAGGSNPSAGNNALFLQTPEGTNSRYGVVPSAAGDAVVFDGGGIDVIQFHLVEAAVASVNTFGADKFSISNPVSNQLTIKGTTSKVNQVVVYSLLGNRVLSKAINNGNEDISLNVSALSTGMYIVELNGENGERLTKKIIKQ
ncbi:T9SS type A sorting domain-containing protein [uncultured Polaribacter sp.]|uniref:T9SS type A sorting domain-containing protein n=1 Tax=uncultured Polaribacter sp. TaxID=174711 RepID=UPI002607C24E|nr:T9SS type A sorting domain-containing protein [uncultured Polaribacter sp.]